MLSECRIERRRDGCAVETAPLSAVVREWVTKWENDHPDLASGPRGKNARGGASRNELGQLIGNESVSAVTILHERTVPRDNRGRPVGFGVSRKRIRRILDRTSPLTELRVADAIVAAIERPDLFYDGTLAVIPNPHASLTAQRTCCGGSLNGSAAFQG